jgi:deoxycytidylate deaminase
MRIVRVGIKRVVAQKRYHTDELSLKLFRDAEINLVVMDNTVEEYKDQSSLQFADNMPKDFKSLKEILMEEGKIQDINEIQEA